MASLSRINVGNRKGWKIQFYGADRKKRVLWIGEMPKRSAEQWKINVGHLISARAGRTLPEPKIAEWVSEQDDHLIERLVKVGLIEPTAAGIRGPETIGSLLDEYQSVRTSLSPRSKKNLGQAIKSFNRYFGAGKRLSTFTLADGLRFREWALEEGKKPRKKTQNSKPREEGLAEATVRKFCQIGRQVFSYAVKRKIFGGDNPFGSVPTGAVANPERSHFVTREITQKIIDNAPNAHWRAVLALSRFGGLRIPSELTTLRWSDIDLTNRRLAIHAPKTGTRVCPIFPELVEYLEDLHALANPGIDTPLSALVIPFVDEPEKNLRSELTRILKRCGVPKWPRLFHNMRATRQTELMAQGFPARDVCSWLGNKEQVAMKHYLMETSEAFDRATGKNDSGCSTGCSITALSDSSRVSIDPQKLRELRGKRTQEDSGKLESYPRQDSNL